MAVTSRSWPDEILHLIRKRERERRDIDERRERKRRREKERERERRRYVVRRKRAGEEEGPEKEVNDEVEEAEGRRCESSTLTLGFDARP